LEAKHHLRIDHTNEDAYITDLISSARRAIEEYLNAALIQQTYSWSLNRFPGTWGGGPWWDNPGDGRASTNAVRRFVRVPRGPLLAVASITTFDEADAPTLWNVSNYYVAKSEDRIYRRAATAWPRPGRVAEGIEIIYDAGFGLSAAAVPNAITQGLLELVASYYLNRAAASERGAGALSPIVRSILDPFRRRRLA
jgi:hypothetical protein